MITESTECGYLEVQSCAELGYLQWLLISVDTRASLPSYGLYLKGSVAMLLGNLLPRSGAIDYTFTQLKKYRKWESSVDFIL